MMSTYFQSNEDTHQASLAYMQSRNRGRWHQIKARLTGRPSSLEDLSKVTASSRSKDRYYAGLRSVPINQIRGSESRSQDFDHDFHPKHKATQSRWMSIFSAWQSGQELPPVELIQAGDGYYVRDGHHRISVAHALGIEYIDADVTIWA